IVEPGNPGSAARTVSAEGVRDTGGDNLLSGYNIIHDESIDQAIELAKACPIIGDGSIEVAEIHEVSM
ncbi:MAG: hypothetical protein VX017_09955, partial [Pseudomonadota bacterium]|nr:hypothetical protein [Pseudomonadota bacterium]